MRNFTLVKTGLMTDFQVSSRHDPWEPSTPAIGPLMGHHDLAGATTALQEAERVIRAQEELIRDLENLAMTDGLTGLANRRGFIAALQRELALSRRDTAAGGVLAVADLDDLKSVNAQLGAPAGDDYLRAAAGVLTGSLRASDIVARTGGDEFVMLFVRMSETAGLKRVAKIEKSFNGRVFVVDDKVVPLRASFGLAPYQGTDTPEAILTSAEMQLYANKARKLALQT
jgi:diguanylate cyclase (GGDEF)-like protein